MTTDDDGVHMGDVGDDDHEDSATSILQEDVFKELEAAHQAAEMTALPFHNETTRRLVDCYRERRSDGCMARALR